MARSNGRASASAASAAVFTSIGAPWTLSAADAAKALGVADVAKGLSSADVERRRAAVGPNELSREPSTPLWKLVLAQFDDMLVKVRVVLRVCRERSDPEKAL
jgi:magnesium-transporting ATPase (P-type)